MKMLVRYEFLKIVRKRSTLVIMTVSLLITAFFFGLPLMQYQTYDRNGVIRGFAGIAHDKAQYEKLSVLLTEEYIADTIREYQKLFENPDNVGYDGNDRFLIGDAYWDFVAPRETLLYLIASNYDAPGENTGLNHLPGMDLAGGAGFYEAREKKLGQTLDTPSRELTENQKEYWRDLSKRTDVPLHYGWHKGWNMILESFELLTFALLAVCIVLAPVFSGEYQAGTDAVILAGKYGRTKLVTAKIFSSYLFGVLAFTLHAAVALGLTLGAFGTGGWNLPLQIEGTAIPYPWTFLQAVLINLGVIYLVLAAMIGLTLFLSANMKSPYAVLAVLVPVIFLPMFLSPNGTAGFYNLTILLLPYRSFMPELGKYISYRLGGIVWDALTTRAVFYAGLTALLAPFAGAGFRRRRS